jgi:hypothetical protein
MVICTSYFLSDSISDYSTDTDTNDNGANNTGTNDTGTNATGTNVAASASIADPLADSFSHVLGCPCGF